MKQLLETLKSARWVEMLLLIIVLCIMIVLTTGGGQTRSLSDEERMERMLSSISGAGQVRVMQGGEAGGILILSEGADDLSVMLALQRAVHTLTGYPLDKIEIAKLE